MEIFAEDTVARILEVRQGLQRVELVSGERAYVLTEILGESKVGDHVVVNKAAVNLDLGTGGWHVVHWNLSRSPGDYIAPGHIMKLRYTSLQHQSVAIEELYQEPAIELSQRLKDKKVLVTGLHSQVGVAAIATGYMFPNSKIAYVMTDGGALPLALSDLVSRLRDNKTLAHTITAGQAFGGDYESLTVVGGVAAAFEFLKADLVIVGMGPGIAGTSTRVGNSALECLAISETLASLGARVQYALRMSNADPRERHLGLSHHSRTVMELLSERVGICAPSSYAGSDISDTVPRVDVEKLLGKLRNEVWLPKSMGRGIAEDPLFYEATLAAVQGLMG